MEAMLDRIDRLLRGELTRTEDLKSGRIGSTASTVAAAGLLLGAAYGVCMGLFACLRHDEGGAVQILFAAIKVPLLFFLTLLVTFPSLYVFSALARSRLRFGQTLLLLMSSTTVTTAVLASLGPVTAFFTVSTRSYPFMQVLNVIVFATAGVAGIAFLRRAARAAFDDGDERTGANSSALADRRTRMMLAVWVVIYGVVGAQMGWNLRPFIGDPNQPIAVLRDTEGNFLRGLLDALGSM